MLKTEAIWLGTVIESMESSKLYPMLNIGSSTDEFRKKTQPWIDEYVFSPARRRGLRVVHTDIKEAPGVDLVGDLCDPRFASSLAAMEFKSILCSNLLEHVVNREEICELLESVVKPGGYIIVSVPYQYPYHADPIDTGFRPTPNELAALFKKSDPVRMAVLDCGTYFNEMIENPLKMIKALARLSVPFYKPNDWWQLVRFYAWVFKPFKVSCLLLERRPIH